MPSRCKLNLENCVISRKCPPWSVLADSSRRFSHLLIGAECVKFENNETRLEFYQSIGDYVTTVEANFVPSDIPWDLMPNIKKMILPYHPGNCYSTIPATVEHIQLKMQIVTESLKKDLDEFKARAHLKNLTITVDAIELYHATSSAEMMELIKWSPELEPVIAYLKDNNTDDIGICFSSTVNFLEHIIEPCDITEIDADEFFYEDILNIRDKFSVELTNLKTVELFNYDSMDGCFFLHTQSAFSMKTVKKLKLEIHDAVCPQCISLLAKIFPNVSSLKICGTFENAFPVVRTFAERLVSLWFHDVHADASEVYTRPAIMCPDIPNMPNLCSLKIDDLVCCDVSFITEIIEKCPNIRKARLDVESFSHQCSRSTVAHILITGIVEGWKNLSDLTVLRFPDKNKTMHLMGLLHSLQLKKLNLG